MTSDPPDPSMGPAVRDEEAFLLGLFLPTLGNDADGLLGSSHPRAFWCFAGGRDDLRQLRVLRPLHGRGTALRHDAGNGGWRDANSLAKPILAKRDEGVFQGWRKLARLADVDEDAARRPQNRLTFDHTRRPGRGGLAFGSLPENWWHPPHVTAPARFSR